MNIERHHKILGLLWLVLGGGVSVMLAIRLFQFIARFGFDITDPVDRSFLIGLLVSFPTFLGGLALFKRKLLGRIAIFVISLVYVAYGVLYIVLAVPEGEGTVTIIIVLCLLVLGLYSFFFLLKTGVTGERK